MKLNSSKSWQFDWMKLQSIWLKLFRGLIASGIFATLLVVLQNTIMPELTAINPAISGVVGLMLASLIESLNKLSKDYSK